MHEKEGPNNQLHLNSDSKEMINYFKTVYIYVKFIELLKNKPKWLRSRESRADSQ